MKFAEINLDTWPRREHFKFFSTFDEPFFGVTVDVDATQAHGWCKENSVSFFGYYLHKTLIAANAVESFKYGIDGARVILYDRVDASPTIMREDGTFGFGFVAHEPGLSLFLGNLETEIDRVRTVPGLLTREFPPNLLHISALPWLKFTSMSHARAFGKGDSCPKISFGKLSPNLQGRLIMPMSIHVHHGLMDGLQVSQFVDRFNQEMIPGLFPQQ